jgi:HAE1 family hydrophobic/amphiphilic exporter-1
MSRFALRYPYLIIVLCLITCVVGVTSLVRMPVDLFPPIKIPVVVVATFFSGMPPEQIETDITGRFERFFTLASGVDHIESRSLPGVSLIKIYFQPGFNSDSAVTSIANLAMADLRKLPPGTLPPVVLKFDASSLPVCLITLKGEGLNEARLRDLGQYDVRNQVANVPGASVPQPFGGRYRQIMVYVDPLKLEAHQLSVMDVVRTVNQANLILPAGDVKIGPYDYNLYANSQINAMKDINQLPLKTVGNASVLVSDVGKRRRRLANPIQHRACGRTAFRVSAGAETGRRRQHHRRGERHQSRGVASARCAEAARDQSGVRSIRLCPQRH